MPITNTVGQVLAPGVAVPRLRPPSAAYGVLFPLPNPSPGHGEGDARIGWAWVTLETQTTWTDGGQESVPKENSRCHY